jgi:predicted component of type VI protein secretion system
MSHSIVVELLDPAQGHPLHSWAFEGRSSITIGRAGENDVVISDPFVSRTHVRLEAADGAWRAVSLSSQQLSLDGQRLEQFELSPGTVFRLGPNGCFLRFNLAREAAETRRTMEFDSALMPIFNLDKATLQREVGEVASSAYFQQLQQIVARRRESPTRGD